MICTAELPTRLIARTVTASEVSIGTYVAVAERVVIWHDEHGQPRRNARVVIEEQEPSCQMISRVSGVGWYISMGCTRALEMAGERERESESTRGEEAVDFA